MAITEVNTGSSANAGDGDSLRTSFEIINDNFTNEVLQNDKFDANTLIVANTDNTPVSLTVPTNSIVCRIDGNIIVLPVSTNEIVCRQGGNLDKLAIGVDEVVARAAGDLTTIPFSANEVLGKSASGNLKALNTTELKALINVLTDKGDIIYANALGEQKRRAIGSEHQSLVVSDSGVPVWSDRFKFLEITGLSSDINTTLKIAQGWQVLSGTVFNSTSNAIAEINIGITNGGHEIIDTLAVGASANVKFQDGVFTQYFNDSSAGNKRIYISAPSGWNGGVVSLYVQLIKSGQSTPAP